MAPHSREGLLYSYRQARKIPEIAMQINPLARGATMMKPSLGAFRYERGPVLASKMLWIDSPRPRQRRLHFQRRNRQDEQAS
ncbi:hypothetical protein D3878_01400 [Noviherbaspirillum sedimenti]|uniref:Uncharacterized protein n=1 Tax=Noviherbaspirillum sedimenti TaxID=2320865 RepID=A0A3A3G0G3_9BURK|nr:hypothetical protein D3878_01400 [Noviherbaspirillum sedimenti]